MLNYYNNTVVPVITSIVKSMQCKFISKTARTRHHTIMYFRDPFKSTPVNQIAELTDKFTRNEVASSNEMRSVLGWRPVDDPRANELRNKNLNAEAGYQPMFTPGTEDNSVSIDTSGSQGGIGNLRLSELRNVVQQQQQRRNISK